MTKTVSVNSKDWTMVLETIVKCPYCCKELKIYCDEDEIESTKVECASCGKHFYIHTNFGEVNAKSSGNSVHS